MKLTTIFAAFAVTCVMATSAYANNGLRLGNGGDASATAVAGAVAGANVNNANRNTNTNANINANLNTQGQLQGQLQGQQQSVSQGNSQSIVMNQTRQAPSMAAPSMSSGHPCAYGSSLAISIVGGGVSGGGNRIDHACMLYQSGQIDAGNYLLASQNADTCRALRAVGAIAAESQCGNERRTTAASTASVSAPSQPVTAYRTCERVDGTLQVRVRAGFTAEQAAAECRASGM